MSGNEFNPPGLFLFRITFDVDETDFASFINDVVVQLRNHIANPRHHGTRMMVLPCPQARRRTWFVIVLRSGEYRVPLFIEAETIYLRGYQNQRGEQFEFAPNNDIDGIPAPADRYLGRASTSLSFNCNYNQLERATQKKGRDPDPGLVLRSLPDPQPGTSSQGTEKEVPRPNFGMERLRVAIRELAQGRNGRGDSQHRTAQNLLLVIIRFCESIRFKSIRDNMARLWKVKNSSGQPSACLSQQGFERIRNWNKLAIPVQQYTRMQLAIPVQQYTRMHSFVLPKELAAKTGLNNVSEAMDEVVVVLFLAFENEPPLRWRDDNNNRRRHGGPGPGPGGAAGGVAAAEPPRWLPVPEQPVMEIRGVYVNIVDRNSGIRGVYGTITVDDGLGAQVIYHHSRILYQRYSDNLKMTQHLDVAQMTLNLKVLGRSVSASDSWTIDVHLCSAATDAPLSTGLITWSICDFSSNTYDRVMRKTMGQAVVEYVVKSRANAVIVDTENDITYEELGPERSTTSADYRYEMIDDDTSSSSARGRHPRDELRRRR